MTDLISRQAVLDQIVASVNQFGGRYTAEQLNMWGLFTQLIKEAASAQPEVIRCKDCKYQRKGQNECEAWNLCGYRPWQYTPITDEHFCSYAERITDE